MAEVSTNWENLSIYYANLSPVYVCSSVLTIVALLVTWWLGPRGHLCGLKKQEKEGDLNRPSTSNRPQNSTSSVQESMMDEDEVKARQLATERFISDHSVMRHIKSARQSAIEQHLTAGLSEEQLQIERETQASQLAAIYKLLKEKEDHFQIKSMDELQEQLKLYRAH